MIKLFKDLWGCVGYIVGYIGSDILRLKGLALRGYI